MAEQKKADERGQEQGQEQPAGKKSGLLKILVIVVAGIALLGAGATAALFYSGVIEFGASSKSEAEGDEASNEEEDAPAGPAVYKALEPQFIVNFDGQGKARFLQLTVEAMSRDEALPEAINRHSPAIRNALVLLFSSQQYDQIATVEGKEALRQEAREAIQAILDDEEGDTEIEAVYFTSFVMQ